MRGIVASLALLAGCSSLSGCIAVVAPIAAAGAIGGKKVLGRKGESAPTPAPTPASPTRVAAVPTPPTPPARPSAPAPVAPVVPAAIVPTPTAAAPVPLPTHEWRAMVTYVAELVQAETRPANGAVLAPGATSGFLPCGAKPFAVIVDADGTVLPPPGKAVGASVPTAQAARAFDDLRFGRVTIIFTSARPLGEASATEDALERAKLGPAMQGRELLIGADAKDAVRAAVAQQYCVLALVGDEASDFSDRRVPTPPWGTGWFRVPAAGAGR